MTEQSLIRPAEHSLFRHEAIDFQREQRQWGDVALLQPLSSKALSWLLTVSVVLIFTFLWMAQYARKETVSGYLTPASGTAKVFAPRPGVIRAIHVKEGQEVEQGQPLLTVGVAQFTADGEDIDAAMLATLATQKAKLIEQIAAQERRTLSERERLKAVIEGLETERSYLQEQLSTQIERLRLSQDAVSSATQLKNKGYLAAAEYRRRMEEFLEQKRLLNSLGQQLAARGNDLVEAKSALEQLPTTMAERVQPLRNELSDTEQRIAEIDGRRAYVIRAPRAGRVSTLQAGIGQVANPNHLQLEILPIDSALRAELFVPTRAIGFVRVGQRVRILYEAFPYQRFGVYGGRVIDVSQTILKSSDTSVPIPLQEPAYKVTVALDRQDVDAYGRNVPLQADMLLRADILLDRRTLMTWLLDPLLSARM